MGKKKSGSNPMDKPLDKIESRKIYVWKDELEEPCFIYVRAWDPANEEVAFSVLGEATPTPDFSECGVFWLKAEDFAQVFRVYEGVTTIAYYS